MVLSEDEAIERRTTRKKRRTKVPQQRQSPISQSDGQQQQRTSMSHFSTAKRSRSWPRPSKMIILCSEIWRRRRLLAGAEEELWWLAKSLIYGLSDTNEIVVHCRKQEWKLYVCWKNAQCLTFVDIAYARLHELGSATSNWNSQYRSLGFMSCLPE